MGGNFVCCTIDQAIDQKTAPEASSCHNPDQPQPPGNTARRRYGQTRNSSELVATSL